MGAPPPLSAAAFRCCRSALSRSLNLLLAPLPRSAELSGLPSVLRYLARVAPPAAAAALYPPGALAACEADAALEFAAAHLQPGAGLEPAVAALDDYLSARTFMAGAAPSLADAAAWGQLAAAPYWAKLRKAAPHAARWFDHLSARAPYAALLEAHGPKKRPPPPPAPAGAPAAKAAGETGSYDVDLPGAEMGKVVTRFPPEPSGYLHVGHAKAALLNQEIARRYAGRLLLRFDDTNPSKEKDEYVDSILADVARLGLEHEPVTYTSDYFPQLEELATRLIEAGHLYADDTPVEVMREERMAGKASARRERPLEETLAAWAAMRAGTEEGRRCCLRLKLDAAAANTALRDPVAYRCNEVPHGRTGEKYKVRAQSGSCAAVNLLIFSLARGSQSRPRSASPPRPRQPTAPAPLAVLPHLRLRLPLCRRARRRDARAAYLRVPRPRGPVLLGPPPPAGRVAGPPRRPRLGLRAPRLCQHGPLKAQARLVRGGGARRRVGRPADADGAGAPAARADRQRAPRVHPLAGRLEEPDHAGVGQDLGGQQEGG
jgi:hypothetical protein